jgi:hypothetical protein
MSKTTKRTNTKLHCQFCAKPRKMLNFLAINTEQTDGKDNVYPLVLRKFFELMKSKTMVHLPKYYSATCGMCLKQTYYKGQNRGNKLEVIPT